MASMKILQTSRRAASSKSGKILSLLRHFYFDGRDDRLRRLKTPSPNMAMIPAVAGSGTFARLTPLAAAKESSAERSAASTVD